MLLQRKNAGDSKKTGKGVKLLAGLGAVFSWQYPAI